MPKLRKTLGHLVIYAEDKGQQGSDRIGPDIIWIEFVCQPTRWTIDFVTLKHKRPIREELDL